MFVWIARWHTLVPADGQHEGQVVDEEDCDPRPKQIHRVRGEQALENHADYTIGESHLDEGEAPVGPDQNPWLVLPIVPKGKHLPKSSWTRVLRICSCALLYDILSACRFVGIT